MREKPGKRPQKPTISLRKPAISASGFLAERIIQRFPKENDANELRAGMRVFHNKFGEGTVQVIEGSGADARARIHFPRQGVKWLALGIAKLTVVE